MSKQSMTISEAAQLAYSVDELLRMGEFNREILFARIARLLQRSPQPTQAQMVELRRQMELTHFHPALVGLQRQS